LCFGFEEEEMARDSKNIVRVRIHSRIRHKVRGSEERPRLAVYRSLKHIYAQVIDDRKGHTVAAASTSEKNSAIKGGGNLAGAKEIGRLVAQRAKEKGINKVVFDRGGYLYHGRIKALAEAAREAGLEF
jgi:large subunit ribosomal protein L18